MNANCCDTLVFFGATGDLAYKKIFPALQAMVKRGNLNVPVIGVAKDAWSAHVFAQNLTNTETSLFTNTAQFVVAQTALRPRVIGVKFAYKF